MKHIDLCGHGRSAARRRVLGLAVLAAASLSLAACASGGHPRAAGGGALPGTPTTTGTVAFGTAPTGSAAAGPGPAASASATARSTAKPSSGTKPPAPVPANQLPGDPANTWKEVTTAHTLPIVHDVLLNECQTVHGATQWQQQGYANRYDTPAVQDTFVFADPGTAQGAYQKLLSDMASCQAVTRTFQQKAGVAGDAVVRQTAQLPDATAWARHWTGVEGISAGGEQTNHIYAAIVVATVSVVQLIEPAGSPTAPIDTTNDATVLAMLTAHLGS